MKNNKSIVSLPWFVVVWGIGVIFAMSGVWWEVRANGQELRELKASLPQDYITQAEMVRIMTAIDERFKLLEDPSVLR